MEQIRTEKRPGDVLAPTGRNTSFSKNNKKGHSSRSIWNKEQKVKHFSEVGVKDLSFG